MPIFWRDKMSVQNALIDRDHRYLICLINTVELALREPEDRQPINNALMQLRDYTREHFRNEEQIQAAIGFPTRTEHRKLHESLTSSLEDLIARAQTEGDPATQQERNAALITLLRDWLLHHVLQEDLLMAPYLRQYPENFTG